MNYQGMRINKSPFHKDSHHIKYKKGVKQIKPNFKISPTAYNDLMRYFKANGMNETDGFRQMVWDKLAMINTFNQRKVFNNIELIMLLPKTDDRTELEDKSRIIALYNTDCDFKEGFNHRKGFSKDFNYQYDLKLFGEGFFREEMNIINSTNDSPVYRVSQGDLSRWETFFQRLDDLNKEEGWDLNLRQCYFVRCPLNNFLDVKREGQFQSNLNSKGDHDGIYVFDDFKKRYFCIINWHYSLEKNGIEFIFEFLNEREFIGIISSYDDFEVLKNSYPTLKNNEHHKKILDKMIEHLWDSYFTIGDFSLFI